MSFNIYFLNLIFRLVEEADFKATSELFSKTSDEKTLDNFIPKTEKDFADYAELVSHKLLPYEVHTSFILHIYYSISFIVGL